MKHTPAPWTTENVDDPNDLWAVEGPDGKHIADVYGQHHPDDAVSPEEGAANARLVTAAPELLTTLVDLMASIYDFAERKGTPDEDEAYETYKKAFLAAEDAIAKAKGGAD